jgi:hypothetical protein
MPDEPYSPAGEPTNPSPIPASDQLWLARLGMFVVGAFTIMFSLIMIFSLRPEFLKKELEGPAFAEFTPEQMVEIEETTRRVYFQMDLSGVVVGIGLCLLGLFVPVNPILMTMSGLVIYVAWQLGLAGFDWSNLLQGWVAKLLFLYLLASAIRAAFAYEQQRIARPQAAEMPHDS